jgi:IS30 family transposase
MDYSNSTTFKANRERGQHLRFEDRCTIKVLHKQGYSLRRIAKEINCSPSTVMYELRKGTAAKTTSKGRPSTYMPSRGQHQYELNRKNCHRKYISHADNPFVRWVYERFTEDKWSLDACVGHAKLHNLFPNEFIVCTKSLYNAVWRNDIGITPMMLPEALRRNTKRHKQRENKRVLGTSIEFRPAICSEKTEFGHWEIDTVVPLKDKKEAVILTIVEKMTRYYISIKVPGKDADSIFNAMQNLKTEYGDKFGEVFKTITSDNGSEFARLDEYTTEHTKIFFAHPYSSFERAQNERTNRMLREIIPKGCSIEQYSDEEVLSFSDTINSKPRKVLGYFTAEELFETHLDQIYLVDTSCVA